jgi:hypothetical protein
MNANVREFFDGYEKANAEIQVPKIAAFYAEVFMFGGRKVSSAKERGLCESLSQAKKNLSVGGLVSSKTSPLKHRIWTPSTFW